MRADRLTLGATQNSDIPRFRRVQRLPTSGADFVDDKTKCIQSIQLKSVLLFDYWLRTPILRRCEHLSLERTI